MKECSPDEIKKIKSVISELSPIAEKAGVSVAELLEQYSGEESAEEESGEDDGKVSMIVARMKAKSEGSESNYEG